MGVGVFSTRFSTGCGGARSQVDSQRFSINRSRTSVRHEGLTCAFRVSCGVERCGEERSSSSAPYDVQDPVRFCTRTLRRRNGQGDDAQWSFPLPWLHSRYVCNPFHEETSLLAGVVGPVALAAFARPQSLFSLSLDSLSAHFALLRPPRPSPDPLLPFFFALLRSAVGILEGMAYVHSDSIDRVVGKICNLLPAVRLGTFCALLPFLSSLSTRTGSNPADFWRNFARLCLSLPLLLLFAHTVCCD